MPLVRFDTALTNARISRIVAAFCSQFGYGGDPQDNAAKRAFTLTKLDEYARSVVRRAEGDAAASGARATVEADVEADLAS